MGEPLKLLIVEDDQTDAELLRRELERGGFDLVWRRVDTRDDMCAALDAESWDVVISDFAMPRFDGVRAFETLRSRGIDVPFIFVSGALGEERAVEAMRSGARDYLLKGHLARLAVTVRRELQEARNRRRQRALELETQIDQRRLALAVQASGAGVFELHLPMTVAPFVSERWAEILGYADHEVPSHARLHSWLRDRVHPDDLHAAEAAYRELVSGEAQSRRVELRLLHRNGAWIYAEVLANVVDRKDDGTLDIVGVMLDVSDRRRLEEQLRQAQKMEAVGQLAGGVAHDFNNLLTAMFSFGAFALEAIDPTSTAHQDVEEIMSAARKAAALTRQLLAFSRRQPISPRILDLNELVRETDRMLRRLIDAGVRCEIEYAADLWPTKIDSGAFEQVLVNLVVNARDAMPKGGKIVIRTANRASDGQRLPGQGFDLPHGDYAELSVGDTGTGMDSATLARIFEPFFTTKAAGRGTGLGLSTCYGIVKQAEGFIWAESKPGAGTTFRVCLPRAHGTPQAAAVSEPPANLRGTEVILLVEDDAQIRALTARTLARLGYTVIEAGDGNEATQRFAAASVPVALLLVDAVIPSMSGTELAAALQATEANLCVLFMSGYTPKADPSSASRVAHVQKPFTPEVLARKIRDLLDARAKAH